MFYYLFSILGVLSLVLILLDFRYRKKWNTLTVKTLKQLAETYTIELYKLMVSLVLLLILFRFSYKIFNKLFVTFRWKEKPWKIHEKNSWPLNKLIVLWCVTWLILKSYSQTFSFFVYRVQKLFLKTEPANFMPKSILKFFTLKI